MDLSKEQIDRIITIAETIGNAIADFVERLDLIEIPEDDSDDDTSPKDWDNLPMDEQFDLSIPWTRILEVDAVRSGLTYSIGLNGAGYMIMEAAPEGEYFSEGKRFQVKYKPWDVDGRESKYYEVIGVPGRLIGSKEDPRYIRKKSTEQLYSKQD